tara:strand:- start:31 stop:762 length:732 start_codon:yes stop_codon:yes gene_type:complete
MNNYDVSCGGIIYPGPQLKITVDPKNKQVMAWIPFTWTEKAFDVAPNYFAFIADRMATIYSRIGEEELEDLEEFVAEVERTAFEFYDAIATPGAVAPVMPEFLYNEEVELDLDELIETEDEEFAEDEANLSPEEMLDELAEDASSEKREKLAEDIESGNIAAGDGGDGNYAISKNVAEDDVDDSDLEVEIMDESSVDIEEVDDFSSDVEEIEEFTQTTDSIPDKKVSISIEQLRKKMEEDKEN